MDELIEKKKVSKVKTTKLEVSFGKERVVIGPPLLSSGVVTSSLLLLFLRGEVK